MTMPSAREWSIAQERGAAARQAGRPITAAPEHRDLEKNGVLRDAWERAWQIEDARRKK